MVKNSVHWVWVVVPYCFFVLVVGCLSVNFWLKGSKALAVASGFFCLLLLAQLFFGRRLESMANELFSRFI